MPKYQLMSHQREAVKFLDSVDGIGALLFDPGVGKTGSALAYIDLLAQRQGQVRVLVVAPLTAADTWVLQPPMFMDSVVKARMLQGTTATLLKKIAAAGDWTAVPDAKIASDHVGTKSAQVSGNYVTILSMSAGAVSTWCKTGDRTRTVQMLRAIRKYAPHVIIVDESHIIKSASANISKAMYQIGQVAPHRIILTGTVNPHSPLDVYGQWRFLAPWTFSEFYNEPFTKTPLRMAKAEKMLVRPWSWGAFKDRYSTPGGYKGKGIGGYKNLTDLNNRVAERSMVVRKEDALDLPPVTDVDVHVTLSTKEVKAYEDMRDELVMMLESGELLEASNPLAKYMKLRQVTAGFAKDTLTGDVHIIGDSKRRAVKEVVETQLAGENRVVVFAYFRSECTMLADSLKARGVKVELITGSTPARERLAIRQRFADVSGNPERTILVAQARTMSLSVNELVTAQNAVFASMSERRDDWIQARGRLDRNGQIGNHVTFWNVYVPNTVDEVMLDNHKQRGDLEKALLDHIRSAHPIR